MRADRLVTLIMLLQTHGRMTARQLADELEVSERTIYRDVIALGSAGIPIYGEAGPDGGYELVDQYRTKLTGLSQSEAQALFMLNIPEALVKLGVGQELRAALLKMSAALPDARQRDAVYIRQRFYLDPDSWGKSDRGLHHLQSLPHLHAIHQAVREDRRLAIQYHPWPGTVVERSVEPYGLVAKIGEWHLVYARKERIRVKRVSSLLGARLMDDCFVRPEDFDLEIFWKRWCQEQTMNRIGYLVDLRIDPGAAFRLQRIMGEDLRQQIAAAPADESGWVRLAVLFESLEAARESLLGFGGAVEVLEPSALRHSMQDFANQISVRYC